MYEGDLLYTPVVKKWYYEVVITDIAVGGESLALDCKKVNKKELLCDSHYGANYQSAQQQELQDTCRCLSWKLKLGFQICLAGHMITTELYNQ